MRPSSARCADADPHTPEDASILAIALASRSVQRPRVILPFPRRRSVVGSRDGGEVHLCSATRKDGPNSPSQPGALTLPARTLGWLGWNPSSSSSRGTAVSIPKVYLYRARQPARRIQRGAQFASSGNGLPRPVIDVKSPCLSRNMTCPNLVQRHLPQHRSTHVVAKFAFPRDTCAWLGGRADQGGDGSIRWIRPVECRPRMGRRIQQSRFGTTSRP